MYRHTEGIKKKKEALAAKKAEVANSKKKSADNISELIGLIKDEKTNSAKNNCGSNNRLLNFLDDLEEKQKDQPVFDAADFVAARKAAVDKETSDFIIGQYTRLNERYFEGKTIMEKLLFFVKEM